MDFIHSIILGAVQGLTEFLPISSSAHLVLFPWFFKFSDPGLAFDVALHLGTLLAVVYYFKKEWINLIKAFFATLKKQKAENFYEKMVWYIIIASIPGALAGFLFEDLAKTVFRSPLIIATTLIIFAFILFIADITNHKKRKLKDINFLDSLIVGIFQALAIIPGVSRSGITMTAGLFRGLKREDSAKFSFLLLTPIIFGAGIFSLREFSFSDINFNFFSGILASTVFGFLAIKYLISYLEKRSYKIFVFYRFALGLLIILLYFYRG